MLEGETEGGGRMAMQEEARPLWALDMVSGKKFGHNSAGDQETLKGSADSNVI